MITGENLTDDELQIMIDEADLDGDHEISFPGSSFYQFWTLPVYFYLGFNLSRFPLFASICHTNFRPSFWNFKS